MKTNFLAFMKSRIEALMDWRLLGLTIQESECLLKPGYEIFVVRINGDKQIRPANNNPFRINVEIEDGIIVGVEGRS